MAVFLVKGARNNTFGNIADAGPFEVYLNNETPSARAGEPGVDLLVHNIYDDTDSKLEDIVAEGISYTNVVSKDSLNAGLGLTTSVVGPQFIFRSVSNCTNGFTYIPPSPTPTVSITPSVTPSVTPTISVTPSATTSVTPTISVTPSITPTTSTTPSTTPSVTPTISITPTTSITPSITPTKTVSTTATPTISLTPTISVTPSTSVTPGVSPTRTPSNTPPPSVTRTPSRSVTRTPSVSVSRTPSISITSTPSTSVTPSISVSKTPPNSPAGRSSSMIGQVGSTNCTQACADIPDTFVWHVGPTIQNGSTLFTTHTGTGTISGGYFTYNDECWVYSAGAYYAADCQCVIEGTLIATSPSSSVAVETLQVGDEVLSKNISELPNTDEPDILTAWSGSNIDGPSSKALVTSNSGFSIRGIYNFNSGSLSTTSKHLHIVRTDNIWYVKRASDIVVGDYYEDINGNLIEITDINFEDRETTVYKLNIETDDVYYANNILTHNSK